MEIEPEVPALTPIERFHDLRRDPRVITVVVVLVGIAAFVAWSRSGTGAPPPADGAEPAPPVTTTSVAAGAVVHVVGAVHAPGVVVVPASARVVDAIAAVGGAAPDADLTRLNLAARVVDGQRIAVPRVGEALAPGDLGGTGAEGDAAGPLNLNTATPAQLEELPGIGPSLAEAIVNERERSGGFKSVDDLQKVRGIGPARFEQLRDLVTV